MGAGSLLSRLNRAKDMGFYENRLYHGTAAKPTTTMPDGNIFDEFKLWEGSDPTRSTVRSPVSKLGVSLAEQPAIAEDFARLASPDGNAGAAILPVRFRSGKTGVIDLVGDETNDEIYSTVVDAWNQGFEAIKFSNYTTPQGTKGSFVMVKNPNQIRSEFAKFNPSKKESANIMAAAVPVGVLGAGIFLPSDDAQAGAFDDLIPKRSNSFADLIPANTPADQLPSEPLTRLNRSQRRQQERSERMASAPRQRNPFEGLSQEVVADIEARFPMPTGDRVRGGARTGVLRQRERAAELEQIRLINPFLADVIEETGGIDAARIGLARGLQAIPRAFGADFAQEEGIVAQAISGLREQQPGAFTTGEVIGESAPFALAGGPLVNLGKTAGQRALISGGVTGAEGFTLAKSEGATTEEALKTGAITSALGPAAELGAPGIRRLAGQSRAERLSGANKLLQEPTEKQIREAVTEAAPSIETLKQASRDIYDEIEAAGVSLTPKAYEDLARKTLTGARELGFKPTAAGKKLNPESSNVIDLLSELQDGVTVADIEDVRRAAQQSASAASRAGRNQDAAIAGSVVDSIDEFLSGVTKDSFGGKTQNIGEELAAARNLWGKARKQELLDEAFEVGLARAAGAERGIRNEFNRILNNKKKARFFTGEEKEALRRVVKGTPTANTFRRLGQMGFGKGQQTNVLGGLAGAGVGSTTLSSMFGPLGAGIGLVVLPTVGTVSKNLAEKLTKNNAKFAGQVIRAGNNADKIAKIYLSTTPKAQRSADDLAALLMRPDLALDKLPDIEFVREAASIAARNRAAIAAGSIAALPAAAEEE